MKFVNASNFGDCIYSLPFCLTVAGSKNISKFDMVLIINYPAYYNKNLMYENSTHPCGNVTMTEELANMLIPLLKAQPYIDNIFVHDYAKDGAYTEDGFRLEAFRTFGLNLGAGSITKWYEDLFPTKEIIDDFNKWLYVYPDDKIKKSFSDKICIVRSQRYWLPLDISILEPYADNIVFIGTDSEYESFKNKLKVDVPHVFINNFLEAAQVFKSCKLCIGNQTGLFSVMEGLKVPRLLEVCRLCPNVIPSGFGGHAVYSNFYFEKILETYLTS